MSADIDGDRSVYSSIRFNNETPKVTALLTWSRQPH
jgi:hypothetical protein